MPASAQSSLLDFLEKAKPLIRDLPGFKAVREIVASATKPDQRPNQNGNWDTHVLPIGVEDFHLTRDGTIVRVVRRNPDGHYPIWSVVGLKSDDYPAALDDPVRRTIFRAGVRAMRLSEDVRELREIV